MYNIYSNLITLIIFKISQSEKLELKEELILSSGKVNNIDITDIYKVPFEKVIDLVRGRKVYLKAGMAYVTHLDLSSVFISYFRENLIAGLKVYKHSFSIIFNFKERLYSICVLCIFAGRKDSLQ